MSPESGWTSSSEDGSFGTSGDSDDWELDFVDQPLMAPAAESMAAAAPAPAPDVPADALSSADATSVSVASAGQAKKRKRSKRASASAIRRRKYKQQAQVIASIARLIHENAACNDPTK